MNADLPTERCHSDAVVPAVFAILAATCFVALAVVTALHPAPFGLDSSVLTDLRADRSRELTEFARGVTTAGSPPVTTFALCIVAALLAWRRRSAAILLLAIGAVVVTGAADSTAKQWVARPRPPISVRVPHVSAGGMSFPSGHTTDAVAFLVLAAVLLAVGSRRQQLIRVSVAFALAGLVGWSRLYLGVHYATDVAGSLFLGASVAGALTAAFRQWSPPSAFGPQQTRSATLQRRPGRLLRRRRSRNDHWVRTRAGLVVLPFLAAGCTGQSASAPASSAAPAASSPTTASATGSASPPSISKVLTIVEENHSLQQVQAGMPFLSQLAQTFGYATNYRGVSHPSLPNYLAMAGGSTFGISDDASPSTHPLQGPSVFGEAIHAGRTARLYAESMPQPCATTPSGPYAVKHAPWAYFVDERALCQHGMIPAGTPQSGALTRDIAAGRLPVLGMLIPNLDHDAHDGTLGAADAWLRQWMPSLLHGPDFTAGHLAIVVTADEDDSSSGNSVLTVVIAPGVRHRVVTTPLTHYSLARMYAEVTGTKPLREAASAPSLASAFGLRLSG